MCQMHYTPLPLAHVLNLLRGKQNANQNITFIFDANICRMWLRPKNKKSLPTLSASLKHQSLSAQTTKACSSTEREKEKTELPVTDY